MITRQIRSPLKSADTPVGLVGCGRMGRPMLEHILRTGFYAVVNDCKLDAAKGLAHCKMVDTARAVADTCEIVFGCVPTVETFDEIVLGPNGLAGGRAISLYVHLGTTGPVHVRQLAAGLAREGITLLDAPVTGGVVGAVEGTLASMVSGSPLALAAARIFLDSYSSSVIEFGEDPGTAQVPKLINNMLSSANLAIAIEGLVAGTKAGIDLTRLVRLLTKGTGNSLALEAIVARHVIPRTFDWGGSFEIIGKDMTSWREMADDLALVSPLSRQVYSTYKAAIAALGPNEDLTAIAKYIESIEGMAVPAAPPVSTI